MAQGEDVRVPARFAVLRTVTADVVIVRFYGYKVFLESVSRSIRVNIRFSHQFRAFFVHAGLQTFGSEVVLNGTSEDQG